MINVVTKSQLGGDAKWFLGTDVESETITLLFCLAEAATALKRVTAVVALPGADPHDASSTTSQAIHLFG